MKQFRVVITGGIGAGKSVVSRICRLEGVPVYDCDAHASAIMNYDPEVRRSLSKLCGDQVYSGKELNRAEMSRLIFSNQNLRYRVNIIVHEAVRRNIERWSAEQAGTPIVMIESAVAATAGLTDTADEIWLVEAPEDVRIYRVEIRNAMSRRQIKERLEAQENEYRSLPEDKTFRILNDSVSPLLKVVFARLAELRQLVNNKEK